MQTTCMWCPTKQSLTCQHYWGLGSALAWYHNIIFLCRMFLIAKSDGVGWFSRSFRVRQYLYFCNSKASKLSESFRIFLPNLMVWGNSLVLADTVLHYQECGTVCVRVYVCIFHMYVCVCVYIYIYHIILCMYVCMYVSYVCLRVCVYIY
jgi:hypothetical protein